MSGEIYLDTCIGRMYYEVLTYKTMNWNIILYVLIYYSSNGAFFLDF